MKQDRNELRVWTSPPGTSLEFAIVENDPGYVEFDCDRVAGLAINDSSNHAGVIFRLARLTPRS
jgi:hypothetical protein